MGPEWIVVGGIIILLFGGSQLPKLARSIGQAQKEFKKGMDEGAQDEPAADEANAADKSSNN